MSFLRRGFKSDDRILVSGVRLRSGEQIRREREAEVEPGEAEVEPGAAEVEPEEGLGVILGEDPEVAQEALGERAAVQLGEGQGVELEGVQKAGPSGDQEVAQ